MKPERVLEWQLGEWLGLSPAAAWILLAAVALSGALLVAWLYRHTLRQLSWANRTAFVVLRSALLFCLLVCLAGPTYVDRTFDSAQSARPLAVMIDRSASMITPEGHGATRLASALKVWKKSEDEASRTFPALKYFRFTESATAADDLNKAVNDPMSGTGTHLFDSITQVMKDAPSGGYGGIVCLTDGLDTTAATPEACAAEALQRHCPLYFAVGHGSSAPRETLLVRELKVPGQVLRKSQFTATAVVQAQTARERDVPLSLLMDGQPVADTKVHLHAGANLIPWTVPVTSGEPGVTHLECRIGDGAEKESIAAAFRVVGQEKLHILFYQGSLDWSFRFVNLAVQNDASFSITGLFSPDLALTREIASSAEDKPMTQMPDKADDLQPYQIVVLANIFADQMSVGQQSALADYVKGGGGVLFLVSDTKMAATFSGTKLESMMPVVFEAPPKETANSDAEEDLQTRMRTTAAGVNRDMETEFAADAAGDLGPGSLKNFALPPGPKHTDVSSLFGTASGMMQNLPKFSTYARVHSIKAGGEVLAVHPDDKVNKVPRALLVTERFGQGQVTALLTDGLWRWKLSLPSTSHDPDIFWQQLLRKLAHVGASKNQIRFSKQPFFAAQGQLSEFRLDGTEGTPVVTAIAPSGTSQPVTLQADDKSWTFTVKPTEPGKWRIHAEDARGAQMETWLRVATGSHNEELSGLPPDTDGLRQLAMSTGGSLLDDGTPANWSGPTAQNLTTLVSKRSQPVWDTWLVLLICLGLYATELIWRRVARLL